MADKDFRILCDVSNDIEGIKQEAIILPGIYKTYEEAKDAIRIAVMQKAAEFRSEGLFITCEDIYTGEVHSTNGFGDYVSSVYYARRSYNI